MQQRFRSDKLSAEAQGDEPNKEGSGKLAAASGAVLAVEGGLTSAALATPKEVSGEPVDSGAAASGAADSGKLALGASVSRWAWEAPSINSDKALLRQDSLAEMLKGASKE